MAVISETTRELRSFRVAQSSAAGTKRGTGRGSFIDSFLSAIDDFYEQVLQNLKPWIAAPPRLRSADEPIVVEPVTKSLVSTSISSQDGPQGRDGSSTATASSDRPETVSDGGSEPDAVPDSEASVAP
jgi:hypothetical protein